MRLYTRSGDDGTTGLFGGQRVSKDHPRVVAYGEADALNAALGCAVAICDEPSLTRVLEMLQDGCFRLGADLATPPGSAHEDKVRRITGEDVEVMERSIDEVDGANVPLKTFILPGGGTLAARLHVARSEARRCERAMVALAASEPDSVSDTALQWVNRCSDLLFALARAANRLAGVEETPWSG